MNHTAKLLLVVSLLFSVCLLPGCGPTPPSREELGRIEWDESKVPGADQPYTMPEYLREAPPAEEKEGRKPGD